MAIWVHIEVNHMEGGGPMVGLSGASGGSKPVAGYTFFLFSIFLDLFHPYDHCIIVSPLGSASVRNCDLFLYPENLHYHRKTNLTLKPRFKNT